MGCKNLQGVHVSGAMRPDGTERPTVFHCAALGYCTLQKADMTLIGGAPMPFCHNACSEFVELDVPKPSLRRFAYYTGTNRLSDIPMIHTMLASMRRAGVTEDLHVFAPTAIPGTIHHQISSSTQWNSHLAKLEFARRLVETDYEFVVWLDTDNHFVRHPGDLADKIRDNPMWFGFEADITDPQKTKEDGWYYKKHSYVIDLFRKEGVATDKVWSGNGGLFMLRRTEINAIADRAWDIYRRWRAMPDAWPQACDEVILACIAAAIVKDPELNVIENDRNFWACDWADVFKHRLPTGDSWIYKDWMTGRAWRVNPAIVHCMRSKILQVAEGQKLMVPQQEDGLEYLTCKHRGKSIGEKINCSCSIDREIYRCMKRGLCVKRLPTGRSKASFSGQLEAVTVCRDCDLWSLM